MKRKFTLRFDNARAQWVLAQEGTDKIVGTFKSKEDGSRAGVLRKTLGRQGGIVVLRTRTGVFDEERIFPDLRA